MKIVVIGTRGIPNILGGVETHCEELYPRLSSIGVNDLTVICRSCYVGEASKEFKGVKLKKIYSPKSKALEAIVHSFLSVIYAAIKRPDVLHIHAIGPSLVAPFARLLGLKVVMTHHGPDYKRQKWGKAAKFFLRVGEWAGVKFSNSVIVISEEIKSHLETSYGEKNTNKIYNGVNVNTRSKEAEYIENYGLQKGGYIFTLGRFVPEKGFDYLIDAYTRSGLQSSYKLVIAGDADHETNYSRALRQKAKDNGVLLPGFMKGEALRQFFSHAALFVLPSFYEGLPISLLEAMSYNLPILASDIKANLQVELPMNCYFNVGDTASLLKKLSHTLGISTRIQQYNMEHFNWDKIAIQTLQVYSNILK